MLVVARPARREYAKRYRRSVIVAVKPDGSFAARPAPILISTLRVVALQDHSRTHLAEASLGRVGVRARIIGLRVSAHGGASLTDPTATARVLPAIPGLSLAWIARLGSTERAICAPADRPVTDLRGRIRATCHTTEVPRVVRFAIRFTPETETAGTLLATTSRWVEPVRQR